MKDFGRLALKVFCILTMILGTYLVGYLLLRWLAHVAWAA
jgi:hypothetical protein